MGGVPSLHKSPGGLRGHPWGERWKKKTRKRVLFGEKVFCTVQVWWLVNEGGTMKQGLWQAKGVAPEKWTRSERNIPLQFAKR